VADGLTEDETRQLRAEIEKLGGRERGVQRVQAVEQYLRAQNAEAVIPGLKSAGQVEAIERLMANARAERNAAAASASAPAPSQPLEPPPGPGRVDEAAYQKMSAAERLDYVRQFPQPTNGAGR
jgi:hypothetical protein